MATGPGESEFTLTLDGIPAGRLCTRLGFFNFVSWAGLDVGCDRGTPVSHYEAPFAFTGRLLRVTVTMDEDQALDPAQAAAVQLSRE